MAKGRSFENMDGGKFLGTQNPNPTPQGLDNLLSLAKKFGFCEKEIAEIKQIYADEKGERIK